MAHLKCIDVYGFMDGGHFMYEVRPLLADISVQEDDERRVQKAIQCNLRCCSAK